MALKNRYRRKERQRRKFTVTRTKAAIGLILSLFFSLLLSPAFDKVVRLLYYRSQETGSPFNKADIEPDKGEPQKDDATDEAVDRLKRITEQGKSNIRNEKKEKGKD